MPQKENTKKILADSLRALLKKKAYDAVTVADIVRRSGMSRNTFYRHFRDKQDLMQWIYLETQTQAIEESSVQVINENIKRLAALMKEDVELYKQVRYDVGQNGFRECFFAENYRCCKALFHSYLGERRIDPAKEDVLIRYFTHASMEICFDKLEGRIQATDEEYVEINRKILEKAIYPLLDYFAQLQEEKDSGRKH